MVTTPTQPPLSLDEVGPIVDPHLKKLASVLASAWRRFTKLRDVPDSAMAAASASSRGMLVSDFTLEPAHAKFAHVPDVWVDERYGRPWVNLAGGDVQIRFRKLRPDFGILLGDSDRATMLGYHLGDPCLDVLAEATVLTAGYVLDKAELDIAHLALVCHIGTEPLYSIPLAGGSATSTGPTQLPLTPLSPPIIRSARSAATERLERKKNSGA